MPARPLAFLPLLMSRFVAAFALSLLVMSLSHADAGAQEAVVLRAADGVRVHGTFVPAVGQQKGLAVLYHMAGSNRGEYATVQPALARIGWASLAIDQRSGGRRWGQDNETAAAVGRDPGFDAALPDMEAALVEAARRADGRPVVVWGSSYSSALVFPLAARHAEQVAGVLAFSPDEYLRNHSVSRSAAAVRVPIFVTSASDRGEIAAARRIADASPARVKVHHVPQASTHGSATLRPDVNRQGSAAIWAAVTAFLDQVAAGAS